MCELGKPMCYRALVGYAAIFGRYLSVLKKRGVAGKENKILQGRVSV